MTNYVYAFVRRDIPLGYQMVQVGHALYKAGQDHAPDIHPHFVLCAVDNQEQLTKLS